MSRLVVWLTTVIVALTVAVCPVWVGAAGRGEDGPKVEGDEMPLPEDPDAVVKDHIVDNSSLDREEGGPEDDPTDSAPESGPSFEYEWRPACGFNHPDAPIVTCPSMYTCASKSETKWNLFARELPNGAWQIVGSECYKHEPPDAAPELRPQVTDVDVLREVRRVGLPDAEVSVQPEGVTLVQLDTIFYTDRPAFERSVTLLGYEVDIRAEPAEFRWHHGDGTEQTSTTPGAPYPAMDVIHRYTDAHVTVRASVDVTYRVRWRVDGAAWHSLDETLTATGPPTSVRVKEATAVLKDPYT